MLKRQLLYRPRRLHIRRQLIAHFQSSADLETRSGDLAFFEKHSMRHRHLLKPIMPMGSSLTEPRSSPRPVRTPVPHRDAVYGTGSPQGN